ncbi:unnamed protein product [Tilletia caries]|nr:unnamed protein product [Tilletia caries]
MADLLKLTKIEHEVKVGGWVRFKRGKHIGDLAQVIDVSQNGEEVGIKFVPRIDMNPSEQDFIEDKRGVKRRRNLGSGKNAINKRPRPQRFVMGEVQRVYPGEVAKRGKNIYKFHNEDYRNGFCEKDVKVTSLIVEDVQPTLQEIELFQGITAEVDDEGNAARAGFSQISIADADNNMEEFQVHDLVMYKNRPAVIFDSEGEGFWVLDEQGDTHLVPPRSLLQSKNNLGVCIDREGHEFRKGDTMKETVGDSPRSGQVVQTHPTGVVFLFSRDISENNGVWYASPSRLTSLTPHDIGTSVKHSLDKMNPARNMQLMASRGNGPTPTPHVALSGRTKDYLKGRHVVVVKGPFKSYRGIIKETLADDKAYVELHTTNRNETFPLALLKEKDPDTGQSKPLAIGGGPRASSGPAQGKSNMRTLYSSGSNGIMGPPMGGGTPCGGMAPETGRTPPMGFAGASTPMGAGHGNGGKKTPFQAPSGVKSFAGPGQGLEGPTPRSAAAVYGARTPKWSETGKNTPAMTKSTASFVG